MFACFIACAARGHMGEKYKRSRRKDEKASETAQKKAKNQG
jgi:hypothetical protein